MSYLLAFIKRKKKHLKKETATTRTTKSAEGFIRNFTLSHSFCKILLPEYFLL